ncbi:hypothetical protein J6X13_03850 [Candidatus Saccharibacteria bacterium]|nr:hypothetical protein [Candidatus Saccharibacteria bacterium]
MSKTTQNNASKKAATTKKPATTTSTKKTPSKKTVPATPDSIMKFLESDSKDRKTESKALAEGQIKIVDLLNALFGRANQNLVNHNKSMLNAKDEVVAKVNGRFDQLDEKLEGFNEKLDEIKEAKEGPVLTGGLIGVTVLVAIVAVIIMVIAAALNGQSLFQVIVLGIFSGIVAAGIALFFGLFRSR